MKIVEASTRCTALLGHSGENAAVQVRFQLSEFRKEFPNGTPSLFVKRPGDALAYPVVLHIDGEYAYWTVTNSDCEKAGYLDCELQWKVNTTLVKSDIFIFRILEGLTCGDKPPSKPGQSWFEKIESDMGNPKDLTTESKDNLVSAINEVASKGSGSKDWAQNDAQAADYVKNRPGAYSVRPFKSETASVQFVQSGSHAVYSSGVANDIFLNSSVVNIVFDSVRYENVQVLEENGWRYAGDSELVAYPFCLNYPEYIGGGSYAAYCYTKTAGTHEITVEGYGAEEIVKIPAKYLDIKIPAVIGPSPDARSMWDYGAFTIGSHNQSSVNCIVVGRDNKIFRASCGFGVGLASTSGSSGVIVGQYGGNPKISHIRPNFENLILCSGDEDHQVECLIAGSDIGVFKIPIVMTELRLASPDERKQYKISVNDDGSLSATEVVE